MANKATSKGNANSMAVFTSFVAAPFKVSRILPPEKVPKVSLIKVPKFVAEQWKNASPDEPCIGLLYTDKNSPGKKILKIPENTTGGICTLQSAAPKVSELHILQRPTPEHAEVLCVVPERTSFVPEIEGVYGQRLSHRIESGFHSLGRSTIQETRRDPGLESFQTLFKFYQPKGGQSDIQRRGTSESSRPRNKQKRGATLDVDALKMRIFAMFEAAGSSGLQLKHIALQTQQPLSHVKAIVEDIAEQRKRGIDRKTVYFLKAHYDPYAVVGEEAPLAKKHKAK